MDGDQFGARAEPLDRRRYRSGANHEKRKDVGNRCLAHKVRNLQSKVPEDLWPEFNARAVRLQAASVKDSHSSSSCRIPAA